MININGTLIDDNGNNGVPDINQIREKLTLDVEAIGLRISNIGVNYKMVFNYDDYVSLSLSISKRNVEYYVPIYNNEFQTYIVIGNTVYPVNGRLDIVNTCLKQLQISPTHFVLGKYLELSKLLLENGITVPNDNVRTRIRQIQSDTSNLPILSGLKANLYTYQESGVRWLSFMMNNKCGCILGDEMGLGKTIQIIATFGRLKEERHDVHFLVVCPVSLLENWKREINKFYPSLSAHVNYGDNRSRFYLDLLPYDVVIVPYSCLQTDEATLSMIEWDIIAADEAQNIKNPSALRTQSIKQVPAKCKIAVSGTPFENHLTDVWSIMDFIMPGYLGNLTCFNSVYGDEIKSAAILERLISPFIIRRLVKDVGNSIPDRIDIPQPIIMTPEEARFYDNGRELCSVDFGLNERTLDKIQKLRLFCTHPLVYDTSIRNLGADPINMSNKYSRFCEIVEEIFLRREKVVVFTSFRKMIDLIVDDISKRFHVYTNFIDGSTPQRNRQAIIDDFTAVAGPGVLVLNPIAAGVGLNITTANHVIHYNLEWNPAKEDQASGRVYRTGQTKKVFVHRLFYVNTIEEFINEKIQRKRDISDNLIVGNIGDDASREDLIKVLNLSPLNN